MKYSHNGKQELTTQEFYESILEHGDSNIQHYYNAIKFYRHKKDMDMVEKVKAKKAELFGVVAKGRKRVSAIYRTVPKMPKTKLELKIKDENCMNCKFAKRDTRNAIVGKRIICTNTESFKFEMPVDAKQVCKWRIKK